MIRLDFQINAAYVVYHTIVNCSPNRFVDNMPDEKIVDFQNAAWSKDRPANEFLRFGIHDALILGTSPISEITNRADRLIQFMINDATFKPLLEETTRSLDLVRSEWESNRSKTHGMVSEMTELDLKGDFRIFLTHPALKQGHFERELRAVCWAYRNTWPNYNTVYLWHEMLHGFIPGNDLEHAVIQFISDNEMRTRLNGGKYPPFEGHSYLTELMKVLLPHWRKYLKGKKKNIGDFITEMSAIPEIQKQLDASGKSS